MTPCPIPRAANTLETVMASTPGGWVVRHR